MDERHRRVAPRYVRRMTSNRQWTVGAATITRVVELGEVPIAVEQFLPGRGERDLDPMREWLGPFLMPGGAQLGLQIQSFCVEVDGLKVLVDTCVGNGKPLTGGMEAMANLDTPMLANLTEAGFGPDDVDLVICTHLHFDHVGWNTVKAGESPDAPWVPTFRKARYVLAAADVEHWRVTDGPYNTFPVGVQPLLDAGVADLVPMDHRVSASLRLIPTPGHSPGHVSVRVESAGQAAQITGDMVHTPVQLAQPSWSSVADTDGVAAALTRQKVVDELTDSTILVLGTHFSGPSAGWLTRDGDGIRLTAS